MYSSLILGPISKDINIGCDGVTLNEIGGAVLYAGYAAGNLGHRVAVVPKCNLAELDPVKEFKAANNLTVFPLDSTHSSCIRNQYHTPDKEQRTSTAISRIDGYEIDEIPDVSTKVIHIAGLIRGDLGDQLIPWGQQRAMVALDVQGVLRCEQQGAMVFHDWAEKEKYLPMIHYLKTDAKEAEVLTGTNEREAASKMLCEWGSSEVMVTHNTEVTLCDGHRIYTQPLKPRNLSGRSGRGDTCFSVYVNERNNSSIEDALLMAAATVSMKMEHPGPFEHTRDEVIDYINEFY